MVKINAQLETSKVLEVEQLLKEFKDIQRSERDSIRTNIAHNWIGHYYTISTSSQI